jgi:hypothetical protein
MTARPDLQLLLDVVTNDLRREWAAGRRPRPRDYASSVPELFADPTVVRVLDDLERELDSGRPAATDTPPPAAALSLTRRSVADSTPLPAALDPASDRVFPRLGETAAGFRLVGHLGRGAFGRVYLAEDGALGGRRVAVKLTARTSQEAQRLARLRHTNVVPVYSVHDLPGGLQAVVMPFLGRRTLAALTADVRRGRPVAPARALWLAARLAAGLAHAHAAGILHLDLKPANVLLADDGEPVLLDFNLSADRGTRPADRAGGTLPYMAPEQLDGYRTGSPAVDVRTDLFGLGVVLYELLAGRLPFPIPPGRLDLVALAAARRWPPVPLRDHAPGVSPAVAAIVHKLLAADPAARYQSADDLLDDLTRQQADRPLAHAPDVSARERLGKWHRRHPRAWLVAAAVAACALAGGLADRAATTAAAAAADRADELLAALPGLRLDLTAADPAAGLDRGAALLAGYGLPADPDWLSRPDLRRLPPGCRAEVQDALGELALLLAHAETTGTNAPDAYARGRDWNRAAEAAFAGRPLPAAVASQRRRLGPDLPPTGPTTAVPAVDLFIEALDQPDPVPLLERLVAAHPGHAAGHCLLADAHKRAGRWAAAGEHFAIAGVLLPADPRPHAGHGRQLLEQQRPAEAAARLTVALGLGPADPADLLHLRAVARLRQGAAQEAADDLTAALAAGGSPALLLPIRAAAREAAGDAAGAAADRAAGLAHAPRTAAEFLARGRQRLAADPAGAADDFAEATRLAPAYPAAWLHRVHVLADRLNRPAAARAAADAAVAQAADDPFAWLARAVLLARLGDRAAAHNDAEAAARLSDRPAVLARLGCVFARTSPGHPADADRAAELVVRAVRAGHPPAALRADPDLTPVRGRPDVRAVLGD